MILDEKTRSLTTNTEDDLKMNSALLLKISRNALIEAGLIQFPVSQ